MSAIKKKQVKLLYRCRQCGYESRKWLGRCPQCDEWESLVEETVTIKSTAVHSFAEPVPLHLAPDGDEERVCTGIEELDRTSTMSINAWRA